MEENLSTNESNQGESKRKLLSPKIDVVFQILFGEVGDENITADLLSTILDEKIESVQLNENIVLRREFPSVNVNMKMYKILNLKMYNFVQN